MYLQNIITRKSPPIPFVEGEKIPWDDPDFSERMLNEHLSQEHDMASRRFAVIDRHVDWIEKHILSGQLSKILDLGCGPGLYTHRLTKLGHRCLGIDFSPASVRYAQMQAENDKLDCNYLHSDIRFADYNSGYDLVMLINGEFNIFSQEDAGTILEKAYNALKPGGKVVIEPFRFDWIKDDGNRGPTWYSSETGLFSEKPHICLQENFWDEDTHTSTVRWYIIDTDSGTVEQHSATAQAYSQDEYRKIIEVSGYKDVEFFPSLLGVEDSDNQYYQAITAKK